MTTKVKAIKTSKIQSVLHGFPKEFMKSPNNETYCNLCSCTVPCNDHFLVGSYQNTPKHQKVLASRSEPLISSTLPTFFSSNIDFVEKVIKAYLSADISLYQLNNKHIKNLFRDIGHSLISGTTCRKAVFKLSADELQRIRNAVHDKQFFLFLMGGIYMAHSV